MKKSIIDKKVNRMIKKLNRQIKEDVFDTRFYVRQKRKLRLDGVRYYYYEFIDTEHPENNFLRLYDEFEILTFSHPWEDMNNLIVNSDFWAKYNQTH